MVSTVITSLIILCQVVTSIVFFWRSRKLKEINWLPKFITGLACIEGIMWSSYYSDQTFFKISVNGSLVFWLILVSAITYPTIMGLLIRFVRVQVQLRAQEENTIKILEAIKRANILQGIFILLLIVSQICYDLGGFGP